MPNRRRPAGRKKWAPYPFPRSCGIRRRCRNSSRLWARCAREWAGCTRTARRNRRSGTACSSATRTGTWDTCPWDRSPARAPRHNSSIARASRCRPCAGCAGRIDRRRAARRRAACGRAICPFFRAFLRRGNRGDRTFDPQTPPSVRLDGLQQLEFMLSRCRAYQPGLYPIGLLHSGGLRNHSLEFACRDAYVREQEMGPLCF